MKHRSHRFSTLFVGILASFLLTSVISSSGNYVSASAAETTITKTVDELMTSYGWKSGDKYKSFDLDANIQISTTGTNTCGTIYGTTVHDWRLYQTYSGDVIATAAKGYTIKSVSYVYSVSYTGALKNGDTIIESGESVTVNGTSKTLTVGNTAGATNGQVKITSFSVTYEPIPQYTINFDNVGEHITKPENILVYENDDFDVTLVPDTGYDIASTRVTMGGDNITSTVVSQDKKTISIPAVTGDVVIASTAEINTYSVTVRSPNYVHWESEPASISHGSSFTGRLLANDGYELFDSGISVYMGGVEITPSPVSNGVITIASVTGDISITADAASKSNFRKYTDNTSTLPTGQYIITSNAFDKALMASISNGKASSYDVSISNNIISTAKSETFWTITNISSNQYTISYNGQYLACAGSDNNNIAILNENSDRCVWNITMNNEGICDITSAYAISHNYAYAYLHANPEGNAFARYSASATSKICLYKIVQPLDSISINPDSLTLAPGSSKQLNVIFNPDEPLDYEIEWLSGDSKVVTVTDKGFIEAVGDGQATIEAVVTAGGNVYYAHCDVNTIIPVSINIAMTTTTLDLRESSPYSVNVSATGTGSSDILSTWTRTMSFDPAGIVSGDDANLTLTPVSEGTTSFTMIYTNPEDSSKYFVSNTLTLNVIGQDVPVENVTLDKHEITLAPGESIDISATISPSTATDKELVWETTRSSIASYDSTTGKIVATDKVGETYIKVRSHENGDIFDTCIVTVTKNEYVRVTDNMELQKDDHVILGSLNNNTWYFASSAETTYFNSDSDSTVSSDGMKVTVLDPDVTVFTVDVVGTQYYFVNSDNRALSTNGVSSLCYGGYYNTWLIDNNLDIISSESSNGRISLNNVSGSCRFSTYDSEKNKVYLFKQQAVKTSEQEFIDIVDNIDGIIKSGLNREKYYQATSLYDKAIDIYTNSMDNYERALDAVNTAYTLLTGSLKTTLDTYKVDVDKADAVDAKIAAIGEVGKTTFEEKYESIYEARGAYEALTKNQKSLVTKLSVLEKAEADYDKYQRIDAAEKAISKIPSIDYCYYKDQHDYIVAADEKLKLLSDDEKALIAPAKQTHYKNSVSKYNDCVFFDEKLASYLDMNPDDINFNNYTDYVDDVKRVAEIYDDFSSAEKNAVDATKYEQFLLIKAKIDFFVPCGDFVNKVSLLPDSINSRDEYYEFLDSYVDILDDALTMKEELPKGWDKIDQVVAADKKLQSVDGTYTQYIYIEKIVKILQMDDTDPDKMKCVEGYANAKMYYNLLTEEGKAIFSNPTGDYGGENGPYARFKAWARYHGEVINNEGTIVSNNSYASFLRIAGESSTSLVLIIISSMSLLTLAGVSVIIFKKKKNHQ